MELDAWKRTCWSWRLGQRKRIELFNLKNEECQKKFLELTSNSDFLSSVFDGENDLNSTTNKFFMRLNTCFYKCFKKIKVTDKPNKQLEELFEKRKVLRTKDSGRDSWH